MSFSPPTEKDNAPVVNRRACPREALDRVVLAYFGQHNWGKLLNLSERGMALEFDQLPPVGQPITFTLEIMGPPRAQLSRELPSNCIQVIGQVVWTQEFERTAGVQFVASAGGTEEQLRQWLSVPSSNTPLAESDKPQQETVSSATQNAKSDITGRRDCSRKALSMVVLAYFGQHNWGKLLNLSESGMALEFDQLPPGGQPISFTLEIMGPSPAQLGRELPRNCIQVNGQVVWTQEFERTAGVRFVSLGRDTQQQIVQWLSLEASATDIADDEIEHDSKEAPWLESPVSSETADESIRGQQWRDSAPRESSAEILSEAEPELEPEPEIQPQLNEELPLETLSPALAKDGKAQNDAIEVQSAVPPPPSSETTSPKTDSPQEWVSELLESNPEILPEPTLASEPQVTKDPGLETPPTVFAESSKAQHNTMDAQSVASPPPSGETTTELADDLQRWLSEFRRSKAEIAAKNAQLRKEPVLDTSPIVFPQRGKVEQDAMQAQVDVLPTSSPEAANQRADVPQSDVPQPQDSEPHDSSPEMVWHAELPRQQKPKRPLSLNAPMVRLALVAACVCLMLFAVVASVRMIRSRWNRTSAVIERIPKPSDKAAPSGTGRRSATEIARAFRDEVVDASKKRPVPRFKERALTSPTDRVANVIDSPAVSVKRSPIDLKLSAPKPVPVATNPFGDKPALTEPPVVPAAVLAVQGKPLGGIPVNAKPPSPLASVSPTHSPASSQFTNGNMASALGVFGSSNGGNGVKIIEVMPNGPAATAGLAVGDVITAIDGNVVSSEQSLDSQLANRKAGSKVRVTFMHSAWMIEATVRIGSLPVTDHTYGFLFP